MKRKAKWLVIVLIMSLILCSCSNNKKKPKLEPDIVQLQAICQLATLESYYHNVAMSIKTKGTGIEHIGEKEREFWIEYTGIARIGVDMSQISMTIDGDNVTVTMPEAELLSIEIDESSLTEDSYVTSQDGFWNKNEITAEDQTEAIANAQEEMKASVEANTTLMANAKERAKKLIENYILQLGAACDVEYNIIWEDAEPTGVEGEAAMPNNVEQ